MENKTSKYIKYAIGEIILVMIGILLALQVNNWNEKKKLEEKTKLLIEQVYSAIKQDNDALASDIIYYNQQLEFCDNLLNGAKDLSDNQLVEILYYLDSEKDGLFEADKYAQEMDFQNISKEHIHLVAQIKNFLNANVFKQSLSSARLLKNNVVPILSINGITEVVSTFGYSSYFNFNQFTESLTPYDLETTRQLLNANVFSEAIKTSKIKIQARKESSLNIIADGNYLIKEIKKEFPNLRLMYDNVGIIGSSLSTGYNESVLMTLKDEYKSIWVIDAKLSEGGLKFRTRNSWTQNWGGLTFPKGYAQSFGKDIYVPEAGFYHIELNLSDNTYEFKKTTD